MFRNLSPLLLTLAFATLTGCYTRAQGETIESRVIILEARQDELRSTLDTERARYGEFIERSEEGLSALEEALAEARATLQRSGADMSVRVDNLESQLNRLLGQLEEADFQIRQLRQEIELLRGF